MGFGAYFSRAVSGAVGFLRAGYPNCAPPVGHVPLLALAPRRVSDSEAAAIAHTLRASRHLVNGTDFGVEITRVTGEMPSPDDIGRVQRRLAAAPGPGTR